MAVWSYLQHKLRQLPALIPTYPVYNYSHILIYSHLFPSHFPRGTKYLEYKQARSSLRLHLHLHFSVNQACIFYANFLIIPTWHMLVHITEPLWSTGNSGTFRLNLPRSSVQDSTRCISTTTKPAASRAWGELRKVKPQWNAQRGCQLCSTVCLSTSAPISPNCSLQ